MKPLALLALVACAPPAPQCKPSCETCHVVTISHAAMHVQVVAVRGRIEEKKERGGK